MMWLYALAAAGSVGGAGGSAQLDDIKCLIAFSSAAESAPATDKAALETGGMYFAGKLFGRDPRFNYNAATTAAAPTLDAMNLQTELQRCGAEMDALARAMDAPAK